MACRPIGCQNSEQAVSNCSKFGLYVRTNFSARTGTRQNPALCFVIVCAQLKPADRPLLYNTLVAMMLVAFDGDAICLFMPSTIIGF